VVTTQNKSFGTPRVMIVGWCLLDNAHQLLLLLPLQLQDLEKVCMNACCMNGTACADVCVGLSLLAPRLRSLRVDNGPGSLDMAMLLGRMKLQVSAPAHPVYQPAWTLSLMHCYWLTGQMPAILSCITAASTAHQPCTYLPTLHMHSPMD
jgi:hypothetical protein